MPRLRPRFLSDRPRYWYAAAHLADRAPAGGFTATLQGGELGSIGGCKNDGIGRRVVENDLQAVSCATHACLSRFNGRRYKRIDRDAAEKSRNEVKGSKKLLKLWDHDVAAADRLAPHDTAYSTDLNYGLPSSFGQCKAEAAVGLVSVGRGSTRLGREFEISTVGIIENEDLMVARLYKARAVKCETYGWFCRLDGRENAWIGRLVLE
ncbi:hypothetical protein BC834DRAFT_847295 [Gloeopeniophorella convolvens]|nr:hypothetical protein BC834DRAFT_847295 [Gloeopeniophorella convolvens]